MIVVPQFAACRPWSNHASFILVIAKNPRDIAGCWESPRNSVALSKESAVSREVPAKGEILDVRSSAGEPQEFGDLLSAVAITGILSCGGDGCLIWTSQDSATIRARSCRPARIIGNRAARHRTEPRPGMPRDSVPSEFGRIICWKNRPGTRCCDTRRIIRRGRSRNSVHPGIGRRLLAGRNRNPAPDGKKGTSWKIRNIVYHRSALAERIQE